MHLEQIRRYPVKAMGGENLDQVVLDARGLAGDRWFAVRDEDGQLASCKNTRRFRRRDAVTRFDARIEGKGEIQVTDGSRVHRVGDPALDTYLSQAMGAPVTVVPEGKVPHQDAGQISLVGTATIAWCTRAWGVDLDVRRLRPNLVIATDEPFIEETWVDRHITIGQAVALHVVERVSRCRTVDVVQDGVHPRRRLLPRLTQERDGLLAVYADVANAGTLAVGDDVDVAVDANEPK
jgi:uncharacterized protein